MILKKTFIFFLVAVIFFAPIYFQFFTSPQKVRIGIVSHTGYCGERELGWRIKIAAESLGWEVFLDEKGGHKLQKKKNLDWVICLIPKSKYIPKNCPSYQTIFHPFHYLSSKGKLKSFYEKYSGYLLTINPPKKFAHNFQAKNKPLFSSSFYPTLQDVEYKEVPLNDLMTMIPVWSNRLEDEKFKQVYKALSQSGFAKFYGIHANREIIETGYMGKIPFDGTSVIDILQKHGIVLIFHSDKHNQAQIPSSRIFEAAAASTVIISDENEFVKKHFGDAVFYVDTTLSAEELYKHIQTHMETIRQNPKAALAMAKKAHQIFVNHFLMSDQLLKIQTMNSEVKKQQQQQLVSLFGVLE